jgi:hypothetical protein
MKILRLKCVRQAPKIVSVVFFAALVLNELFVDTREARLADKKYLDTISPKQDQKHRHDQASPSVMKSGIFFGADFYLESFEFVEKPLPW